MSRFPITRQLIPTNGKNLAYLAKTAALTRLGIAGLRVWQNSPSKNHNPEYTRTDKFSALWERMFVEFVGTTGYLLTIHATWDTVAKYFEKKMNLPRFETPKKPIDGLSKKETQALFNEANKAMESVYGKESRGLIKRVLFDSASRETLQQTIQDSLKKQNIEVSGKQLEKHVLPQVD